MEIVRIYTILLLITISIVPVQVVPLTHRVVACTVHLIIVHLHRYFLVFQIILVVLTFLTHFLFPLLPVQLSFPCLFGWVFVDEIRVIVHVLVLEIFGKIGLGLGLYLFHMFDSEGFIFLIIIEQVFDFFRHFSIGNAPLPELFVKTKQYENSGQSLIQKSQNDRSHDPG